MVDSILDGRSNEQLQAVLTVLSELCVEKLSGVNIATTEQEPLPHLAFYPSFQYSTRRQLTIDLHCTFDVINVTQRLENIQIVRVIPVGNCITVLIIGQTRQSLVFHITKLDRINILVCNVDKSGHYVPQGCIVIELYGVP